MNVKELCECGYMKIAPVVETLVSYLSQDKASSLKYLVLLYRPLQTTSWLIGNGCGEV